MLPCDPVSTRWECGEGVPWLYRKKSVKIVRAAQAELVDDAGGVDEVVGRFMLMCRGRVRGGLRGSMWFGCSEDAKLHGLPQRYAVK